jgi:hypothetical protein
MTQTRGIPTFGLDIHIPLLIMRRASEKRVASKAVKYTPQRNIFHLSVLDLDYDVEEAHFSMSISGSDDDNWKAYGFEDEVLKVDKDEDEDDDSNEEGYPDVGTFSMDPFAPGGQVDTKKHRKDPREYALIVYEDRMHVACDEWCYLINTIDDQFVGSPSLPRSWHSRSSD